MIQLVSLKQFLNRILNYHCWCLFSQINILLFKLYLFIQFDFNRLMRICFILKVNLASLLNYICQITKYIYYFSNLFDYKFFKDSIYCKSIDFYRLKLHQFHSYKVNLNEIFIVAIKFCLNILQHYLQLFEIHQEIFINLYCYQFNCKYNFLIPKYLITHLCLYLLS